MGIRASVPLVTKAIPIGIGAIELVGRALNASTTITHTESSHSAAIAWVTFRWTIRDRTTLMELPKPVAVWVYTDALVLVANSTANLIAI